MAMSKEEQKAAAARIMAKLGPLNHEEQITYHRLTTEPDFYPASTTEFRVCQTCGEEFRTNEQLTAFQQFADHQTLHNPAPSQWAEAHKKIQRSKQKPTDTP